MDIDALIQSFLAQQEWLALLILFGASLVEYVFPPFPGDTVTLAGAVLVTGYGWSAWRVFLATTAGGVVGAMADFWLGVWILRRRGRREAAGLLRHGDRIDRARAQIDRLVEGFRRHGAVYLVINRFLPGLRAFFFVAAGLADMRPAAVAFYAGVSAALYNALIIGVGMAIGANLDTLERLFSTYSTVVWGLLGVVVAVLVARRVIAWRRRRRAARRGESGAMSGSTDGATRDPGAGDG